MSTKNIAVPERVVDNAQKVTFLVYEYPDHTLSQIIELLQLPAIDINAAIWYAQDKGWLSEPDDETGKVTPLEKEHKWELGKTIDELEELLLFSFEHLAKKETDLEEVYLSNWTSGYRSHDVMIALKDLESNGLLVQYQIEDGENKYIFFTLAEHKDKLWGQKQFKKNPLTDEDPLTEENTAEEEKSNDQKQ